MLNRTATKPLNQSQVSILIEKLVLTIQKYDRPIRRHEQGLKQYFNHIEQMLGLFDGNYDYSYSLNRPRFPRHSPSSENSAFHTPLAIAA